MARYTIREFAEAVGLGVDRENLTRSGIILKALCGLGAAKEVGTRKNGPGRPAAIFEVSDPIVIPLGQLRAPETEHEVEDTVLTSAPELDEEESVEDAPSSESEDTALVEEEPVASVNTTPPSGSFFYDEDDED